jgi:hypothetical protein
MVTCSPTIRLSCNQYCLKGEMHFLWCSDSFRMLPDALFSTLLLAVHISASPVVSRNSFITLPIARRLNLSSTTNILQSDQARAAALKHRGDTNKGTPNSKRDVISTSATNDGYIYSASVGIGSPPTYYDLLVDTGSSDTWVGAGKPYVATNTSVPVPGYTMVRSSSVMPLI